MPAFPVPVFASALLACLCVAAAVRGVPRLVLALLSLCAAQLAIIALHQHYGVAWLRLVQPVTACAIPPLAWLTFRHLAVAPVRSARELAHALPPALAAMLVVAEPVLLDPAVALVFAGYGLAMLWALRHGPDALLRERLEGGSMPLAFWRMLGLLLVISAMSDVAIALDHEFGSGRLAPWIVSGITSLTLFSLGAVSLWRAGEGTADGDGRPASPPAVDEAGDRALVDRLKRLLDERELHRDPDLTVGKLARRLVVPAKALSGAINRSEGRNVSQFVNDRRIAAACAALREGETVTSAMLQSGFRTKSNFNREFRRVTGRSPTEWLAREGSEDRVRALG